MGRLWTWRPCLSWAESQMSQAHPGILKHPAVVGHVWGWGPSQVATELSCILEAGAAVNCCLVACLQALAEVFMQTGFDAWWNRRPLHLSVPKCHSPGTWSAIPDLSLSPSPSSRFSGGTDLSWARGWVSEGELLADPGMISTEYHS